MANLICDLHIWSMREDLTVRDTDFSAFKYYDKNVQKTVLEKPYAQVNFNTVSIYWEIIEAIKKALHSFAETKINMYIVSSLALPVIVLGLVPK